MFAIDTETALISEGLLAPPLACVSVRGQLFQFLFHWTEAYNKVKALLGQHLVGHNIAYDMGVLYAQFPDLLPLIFKAYEENRITDTMLREQLIHIAGGVYRGYDTSEGGFQGIEYSLDALSQRHLKVKLDKNTWRLQYGQLRELPLEDWPEGAKDYALTDAVVTHLVWEKQEANAEYLEDQYRQARAAWWLHLTSMWGITTDKAAVEKLGESWVAEGNSISEELIAAGLIRPDGTRNTAVAKALMAKAWPECPITPTGEMSLAHQNCLDSGEPLLVKYAEMSSLKKKLSTDLPMLRKNVVQARYTCLMESGRTSSSKPNIQNLPRKPGVRECYVPREGFVFVAADYSAAELHTWSQACIDLLGQSTMANVLNAGRDPHAEMAMQLGYRPGDEEFKNARQVGKVANFGFPGGLGIDGFMAFALSGYGLHLTQSQAQEAKRAWLTQWPEAEAYFTIINKTIQGTGTIKQLRTNRTRGGVSFCQACNTLFQGLAADGAKEAGWRIAKACYLGDSILHGSRIVAFIHDEFIVEVPEMFGHECAMEVSKLMKEGMDMYTPDVPNKVEAVLSRRWSKLAKPVYVDGRLIPWEQSVTQ